MYENDSKVVRTPRENSPKSHFQSGPGTPRFVTFRVLLRLLEAFLGPGVEPRFSWRRNYAKPDSQHR